MRGSTVGFVRGGQNARHFDQFYATGLSTEGWPVLCEDPGPESGEFAGDTSRVEFTQIESGLKEEMFNKPLHVFMEIRPEAEHHTKL